MTNARTLLQVIGNIPSKNVKKIEFLTWINTDDKKFEAKGVCSPSEYNNVVLVSKDNGPGKDVMLAYSSDPMSGCLYLGNWNDGVV